MKIKDLFIRMIFTIRVACIYEMLDLGSAMV